MNSFETKPDVSVIVAVRNEATTLQPCIESLLKLDYPVEKRELIFVNNNSDDETGEILLRYQNQIRILEEKTPGPAAARNTGLRNAKAELIAFTDADCIVHPNWLRHVIAPLFDPDVGITGGRIVARPGANEIEKFAEHIHSHFNAIHVFKPPYAITMNWASRLSVLKQHHFFDETFLRSSDVELSYRICQSGYKIVFHPEAIVFHHNEKSFTELIHKGFLHGFHSIKVYKQYSGYLRSFGHSRWNLKTYKSLYRNFVRALFRGDHNSKCNFFFNFGKKIGKYLGCVRFFYLDL